MNGSLGWKARQASRKTLKSWITNKSIRQKLVNLETTYEMFRNVAGRAVPALITPSPKYLTIAITARCNLRCQGCLYGRGYMAEAELPTEKVVAALRDAAAAGVSTVRLYGGEPLLHRGLPDMIKECCALGMTPFVSTNGLLLEKRLDSMIRAGLRIVTFGYYGYGPLYDSYVGAKGAWERFEAGIARARRTYQNQIELHTCFVLNTRTCSLEELDYAWRFAERYELKFHVDLVHYSLPYFTEGADRELQFKASDAGRINRFVSRLEKLKQTRPDLYAEPTASIRSIPDWLLKGSDMRVPCDAYNMIWIGADGSVRLCFVTFPLGNLYQSSLGEMLFRRDHERACQDAVKLKCPNCHCGRDTRISKHLPSLLRYSMSSDLSRPMGTQGAASGRDGGEEMPKTRLPEGSALVKISSQGLK